MVYTLLFFPSKCSLFHNSNIFGSCVIHILYTVCAKIKKNNSGAKRLIYVPDWEFSIPVAKLYHVKGYETREGMEAGMRWKRVTTLAWSVTFHSHKPGPVNYGPGRISNVWFSADVKTVPTVYTCWLPLHTSDWLIDWFTAKDRLCR